MPARVSDTFVLRTYPFREADLIVSFLTRDLGKLRGVARRARRPKSPFGSGLERLSQVRMAYFQKENAELVNLSSCELIESQFGLQSEYALSVVLDYFTEVAEQLLPAHEPNEKFFRLLVAMLARRPTRKRFSEIHSRTSRRFQTSLLKGVGPQTNHKYTRHSVPRGVSQKPIYQPQSGPMLVPVGLIFVNDHEHR